MNFLKSLWITFKTIMIWITITFYFVTGTFANFQELLNNNKLHNETSLFKQNDLVNSYDKQILLEKFNNIAEKNEKASIFFQPKNFKIPLTKPKNYFKRQKRSNKPTLTTIFSVDKKGFSHHNSPCFNLLAPNIKNAEVKYLRRQKFGNERLQAKYICHFGYEMIIRRRFKKHLIKKNKNLICKNGIWVGKLPLCRKIRDKKQQQRCSTCDQLCFKTKSSESCGCYKGFDLVNNSSCVDIDECKWNPCGGGGKCVNKKGNYECICRKGFRRYGGRCIDVNECLLRNGRGFCESRCENLEGSYKCSCFPGTRISPDGHSCEEDDLCRINGTNGGCSHNCISVGGIRTICSCDKGYKLDDDQKNCLDIDECLNNPTFELSQRCSYECLNTLGSFKCIDFSGDQQENEQDIFKFDLESFNQENSEQMFRKTATTTTTAAVSSEEAISSQNINQVSSICPPLFPPSNGFFECFRPTNNATDDGRLKITNLPGSNCTLKCPTNFLKVGSNGFIICGHDGKWIGRQDGICSKVDHTKQTCIDITTETTPNSRSAKIKMPVIADLNINQAITIKPSKFKNINGFISLKKGLNQRVSFTLKDPVIMQTKVLCRNVNVLEGQAPKIVYCPKSLFFTVENYSSQIHAFWKEPEFVDNVKVTKIYIINVPTLKKYGVGNHQVSYEAADAAGYSTKCSFKVIVQRKRFFQIPHY